MSSSLCSHGEEEFMFIACEPITIHSISLFKHTNGVKNNISSLKRKIPMLLLLKFYFLIQSHSF